VFDGNFPLGFLLPRLGLGKSENPWKRSKNAILLIFIKVEFNATRFFGRPLHRHIFIAFQFSYGKIRRENKEENEGNHFRKMENARTNGGEFRWGEEIFFVILLERDLIRL
jgi:hypothetical protein